MSTKELPLLPKSYSAAKELGLDDLFTADQMRDYARAALAAHPVAQVPEGWNLDRAKLYNAMDRMDRARKLLTGGNPRPECNWGMLDTSDLRASLAAAPSPEASKPVQAESSPQTLRPYGERPDDDIWAGDDLMGASS